MKKAVIMRTRSSVINGQLQVGQCWPFNSMQIYLQRVSPGMVQCDAYKHHGKDTPNTQRAVLHQRMLGEREVLAAQPHLMSMGTYICSSRDSDAPPMSLNAGLSLLEVNPRKNIHIAQASIIIKAMCFGMSAKRAPAIVDGAW